MFKKLIVDKNNATSRVNIRDFIWNDLNTGWHILNCNKNTSEKYIPVKDVHVIQIL